VHGGYLSDMNCLNRTPTQTAIINFVQCEMLIIDVFCFI
jgi:hypothetical protein